jgi:hypothetical protein
MLFCSGPRSKEGFFDIAAEVEGQPMSFQEANYVREARYEADLMPTITQESITKSSDYIPSRARRKESSSQGRRSRTE